MGRPVADDDEWEELERSGLLDEADSGRPMMDGEEVSAVDGEVVREAQGVPAPKQPTKAQIALHNLTHLPYRSWCPHCLAARRPNASHRRNKSSSGRTVPLFCADYAFIRKPEEDPAVDRLAEFLKSTGIQHLVYKSDQEASIRATIEKSLERLQKAWRSACW